MPWVLPSTEYKQRMSVYIDITSMRFSRDVFIVIKVMGHEGFAYRY